MSVLHDTFEEQSERARGVSRRGALRSLALGGAAAFAVASLPGGNEAVAQDQRAIDMADEMETYSKNPQTRGIGVFINLQHDATIEDGEGLGDRLKRAFASRGVPLEYRINQSRGTATDVTFYVRGNPKTYNVNDMKGRLGNVLASHQGAWLPEQVSENTVD